MLKGHPGLAARYGVPVDTSIRTRVAPHKAIVRVAGAAMVVVGVTQARRDLFFGDTASAVLGGMQLSGRASGQRAHQARYRERGGSRPMILESQIIMTV